MKTVYFEKKTVKYGAKIYPPKSSILVKPEEVPELKKQGAIVIGEVQAIPQPVKLNAAADEKVLTKEKVEAINFSSMRRDEIINFAREYNIAVSDNMKVDTVISKIMDAVK